MAHAQMSVEAALSYLAQRGFTVPSGPFGVVEAPTKPSGSGPSLCQGFTGSYSIGLHVGAIFLILGVSFLGTAIPILGKCIPWLVRYPFVFSVAKTAATGVLLSVSTIHLVYEGAEAFKEDCIPQVLKNYGPLYFLLALIAILLMQALDMQLAAVAERWVKAKMRENADTAVADADKAGQPAEVECREICRDVEVGIAADAGKIAPAARMADSQQHTSQPAGRAREEEVPTAPNERGTTKLGSRSSAPVAAVEDNDAAVEDDDDAVEDNDAAVLTPPDQFDHHHHHATEPVEHGHQHLSVAPPVDMGAVRRVIAAVCMEFGVTLHSVFVGLTVGLTADDQLKPLIVALVFHQLFEGMAMGSRIADADFTGSLDIILALVFAFSAPLGMAAATIAVSVSPSAMSGPGFASLVGFLDTFCGGILLYLAFTLLLGDFVSDVKHYCGDEARRPLLRKVILFAALWIGMGLMALVGNWL